MRKWLILTHRYLGIALSVIFVSWFASGIAMLYGRGMPRLTPDLRLERIAPIDTSAVRLSASEALERAELDGTDKVTLLTLMGRPAYRFGSADESTTVFADNGELLLDIDAAHAQTIAATFVRLPENRLHHVGRLTEPDQWSLTLRQGPMHKFTVDDAAGTQVYVSERNAEVTVLTTRGSRALAWVGVIPHFLYFAPLRLNQPLWRQIVLWTSGIGIAARAPRHRSRDRPAQNRAPIQLQAYRLLLALLRLDAMALRDRTRLRRVHADIRLQRMALDGAMGLGDERRPVRRRTS